MRSSIPILPPANAPKGSGLGRDAPISGASLLRQAQYIGRLFIGNAFLRGQERAARGAQRYAWNDHGQEFRAALSGSPRPPQFSQIMGDVRRAKIRPSDLAGALTTGMTDA